MPMREDFKNRFKEKLTPGVEDSFDQGEIRNVAGDERQIVDFGCRGKESMDDADGTTHGFVTGNGSAPGLGHI